MRVVAIVQARMGSTRLPGKVIAPLAGRPLVWHIFERISRAPLIDDVILATTSDPRNSALMALAKENGWKTYQHAEEDDLLGRFYEAARLIGAEAVLRVAADCPLVDSDVMNEMVREFRNRKTADFVSNRVNFTYPLGLSCDVISFKAIERCHRELSDPEDRELFAWWIRNHPSQFDVVSFENSTDLSEHNWTVDTPEDLDRIRRIFDALYRPGETFGLASVLHFLSERTREHG